MQRVVLTTVTLATANMTRLVSAAGRSCRVVAAVAAGVGRAALGGYEWESGLEEEEQRGEECEEEHFEGVVILEKSSLGKVLGGVWLE